MISRDKLVSFTVNVVIILVFLFIVLDFVEGRRFMQVFEKEKAFAEQ